MLQERGGASWLTAESCSWLAINSTLARVLIITAQSADKLIKTRRQPLYLQSALRFSGVSTDMAAIFVQVNGLNQCDFKNWWNRGTVQIILSRLCCFNTGCLCGEREAEVLHLNVSYFSQSSWQLVTDHQWVNNQISGGTTRRTASSFGTSVWIFKPREVSFLQVQNRAFGELSFYNETSSRNNEMFLWGSSSELIFGFLQRHLNKFGRLNPH